MNYTEKNALAILFELIAKQHALIGTARRRAYRKSVNPDFGSTDYTRTMKDELQSQLHYLSRAEYLTQVGRDYLGGIVSLTDLNEVIADARIWELIPN